MIYSLAVACGVQWLLFACLCWLLFSVCCLLCVVIRCVVRCLVFLVCCLLRGVCGLLDVAACCVALWLLFRCLLFFVVSVVFLLFCVWCAVVCGSAVALACRVLSGD